MDTRLFTWVVNLINGILGGGVVGYIIGTKYPLWGGLWLIAEKDSEAYAVIVRSHIFVFAILGVLVVIWGYLFLNLLHKKVKNGSY